MSIRKMYYHHPSSSRLDSLVVCDMWVLMKRKSHKRKERENDPVYDTTVVLSEYVFWFALAIYIVHDIFFQGYSFAEIFTIHLKEYSTQNIVVPSYLTN
mmetsp:Transcript_57260/g.61938  ORF Transcript_57260/g.61938 Transcript_57260/m.61938 type:complete len:99 (+) Transcript_57260:622-918(+)